MGTSVNQRSPSTPNWRAVEVAYSQDKIPIERAVKEIWRAATNQPVGNLAVDLAQPIIASCLRIAQQSNTSDEAVRNVRREIALSEEASLAADIAQRAVYQSFSVGGDRTDAFVRSLFGEAGNYLVSRDIPGFVGLGRAQNVSDVIEFKNSIRREIERTIGEVGKPRGKITDADTWRLFVSNVVTHLARRD